MFDESIFSMFQEKEEEEKKDSYSKPDSTYNETDDLKPFVLSIGGSLLVNEKLKPNTAYIAKLSELIGRQTNQGRKIVLVAGGGKIARTYIAAAKSLGASNYALDEIGIMLSRVNAKLLIQSVKNAYSEVLINPNKAKDLLKKNFIPVYAGLYPGITTDAVAALIAETINGKFINLSNVDGIYSSDPTSNPRAKFYESLTYDRLLTLMSMNKSKPGQNIVIDVPACLILKRSLIESVFLNGLDLENLENLLNNYSFKGTILSEHSKE